jgi:exodeoxyribonuclease VII large subunit
MPEILKDKKVFTLFEVTRSVQKTLSQRYSSIFWVKAEMNKLNHYSYSGHCYPELIDKKDGKVIAQIKATLWKDDYFKINKKFISVLKEPVKDGIKILFSAKVIFDPVHGLSLQIIDIDPEFTLGDLEREKKETIEKLKSEGLFDLNKLVPMPLLPKRIAIISVETSKGYADFLNVITKNEWAYSFFHVLFPALLQGEKAVDSILGQLENVKKVKHHFDVVAIIRGGGGDVGLSCYNNFRLSEAIARFPIPVITGIGHATNETVVEMVSYKNAITPTKIAGYLIQKFHEFSEPLQKYSASIKSGSLKLMGRVNEKLFTTSRIFSADVQSLLSRHNSVIDQSALKTANGSGSILNSMENALENNLSRLLQGISVYQKQKSIELENIEKQVKLLDPRQVLKRGYSITKLRGKSVLSTKEVKNDDILESVLYDGTVQSIVVNTNKEKKS